MQRAIQYDALGKNRNNTAPTSAEPKLGYTGHQLDVETGVVYARARYHDSELGIFLSSDPREPGVGDAPWLNRYLYVKGNPLAYVDPSGEIKVAAEYANDWDQQKVKSLWLANSYDSKNGGPGT